MTLSMSVLLNVLLGRRLDGYEIKLVRPGQEWEVVIDTTSFQPIVGPLKEKPRHFRVEVIPSKGIEITEVK